MVVGPVRGCHARRVLRSLQRSRVVSPRWLAEPAAAVRAIGEGLRALRDTDRERTEPRATGVETNEALVHLREGKVEGFAALVI